MYLAENELKVFHNISLLYPLAGPKLRKGEAMGKLSPLKDAYIVVGGGKVKEIGTGDAYKRHGRAELISLEGALVLPGFIDSHTHLVHAGSRENEMRKKLAGVDYLDILKSGGGILATVRATRNASFQELYREAEGRLKNMLAFGVTAVEAKSGYGLDLETELKQLEVVRQLNQNLPQTLVPTFMGAHALPEGYQSRKDFLELMKRVLDAVKEGRLAHFVDIFCEEGVFSAEEAREFLGHAQAKGFGVKIHADEMNALGGAAIAAELGAVSAEHLLNSSEEDLRKLAESETVAVLLPLTSFYLNKNFAPARKLIDFGAAVAIASDYNPGSSPSENLQLAMQLAVLKMGLTPEEVLSAVTVNAAKASGLHSKGSLEPGMDADFVVLAARNLDYVFYRFGINLVREVYIGGKRVLRREP